jgi:excisionase family DNA binding protein
VRVPGSGSSLIQEGEQVPLPEGVYRVLVEVVEAMRAGKVITLVPRTQRLTTQEAADFLGVSRPTMVKVLEDGKIPYEQPGRHRRILFTDLLAYTERQHAGRRAALDRMTEDASEVGIATRQFSTPVCSCRWRWPTRCCA